MIRLASYATSTDFVVWPLQTTLGKLTRLGRQSVRKWLRWLEENDYLRIYPVPGRASAYQLRPKALAITTLPPSTRSGMSPASVHTTLSREVIVT